MSSRIRSPAHPDAPLQKAVEMVARLEQRIRTNTVDRDTAVKEMGYSGMTGASGKMLANLLHFGLLTKAGKGAIKVSPTAIDILHQVTDEQHRRALRRAAFSPALYQAIKREFADGVPTETWLRSFLARRGFASIAIEPALRAYLDTCDYLKQKGAYESHGGDDDLPLPSPSFEDAEDDEMEFEPQKQEQPERSKAPQAPPKREHVAQAAGDRVVFIEEVAPGQSLKVSVAGDLNDTILEALEDFVRRQRKRIAN